MEEFIVIAQNLSIFDQKTNGEINCENNALRTYLPRVSIR